MSGLGAALITFVPNQTAKSGDVNSNFANLNAAASPSFSTLGVTGASSLDNGAITTNGSGTLSAGTVSAGTLSATTSITGAGISVDVEGGITVIRTQPTNDPMIIQINGHNFQLNTDGSITVAGKFTSDNGAFATDGSGNLTGGILHSTSPTVLRAGNQETGFDGGTFYTPSSGVGAGVGVNFKTYLTNTPSSITLSAQSSVAVSGLGAFLLQTTGFELHWLSTAGGSTQWYGTYTTVGNCLLAVDELTRTFDHHCDECKAVHNGVALTDLTTETRQGEYHHLRNHVTRETHRYTCAVKLGYVCPDCGAVETFDTRMTSADEQDKTPQGTGDYQTTRGAQARMIRELLKLLALPVA